MCIVHCIITVDRWRNSSSNANDKRNSGIVHKNSNRCGFFFCFCVTKKISESSTRNKFKIIILNLMVWLGRNAKLLKIIRMYLIVVSKRKKKEKSITVVSERRNKNNDRITLMDNAIIY